jgi:hypothetical protein
LCSLSSGRFAPCQARLSPLFNSEALYSEALYSEALYSEALNSERQRALYTSHQRAPASASERSTRST